MTAAAKGEIMTKTIRKLSCGLLAACAVLFFTVQPGQQVRAAFDGSINQSKDHSQEESMYRYDLDIALTNPCNSDDMDRDAVYELWFDFIYRSANGYGKQETYRFDMSWKNGKNLNSELLWANFIRKNDDAAETRLSVWVPGILDQVRVHLNMDGGERLSFEVIGISLDGHRVNTDTDNVSSAYYDSNAVINCRTPASKIDAALQEAEAGAVRDQYGGLVTQDNVTKAVQAAKAGDESYFYRYNLFLQGSASYQE